MVLCQRVARVVWVAIVLGCAASAGQAQVIDPAFFPNLVGVGVGTTTDYTGASSRSPAAAPLLRYQFKDTYYNVSVVGPMATANLINRPDFHGGPMLRYRFGRSNADDPVVRQLHEIDSTVDAGAYLSYGWSGEGRVPWRARVSANVLTQAGGVDDGTSGSLNAQIWIPLSQRFLLATGAALDYGSAKFMNTYYGVTADDSVRSSLAAYQPGAGLRSVDLWLGAMWRLDTNWVVGTGVYWQRLTGDAADSPIVRQRGSANQVSGGVGLAYVWN